MALNLWPPLHPVTREVMRLTYEEQKRREWLEDRMREIACLEPLYRSADVAPWEATLRSRLLGAVTGEAVDPSSQEQPSAFMTHASEYLNIGETVNVSGSHYRIMGKENDRIWVTPLSPGYLSSEIEVLSGWDPEGRPIFSRRWKDVQFYPDLLVLENKLSSDWTTLDLPQWQFPSPEERARERRLSSIANPGYPGPLRRRDEAFRAGRGPAPGRNLRAVGR